MSLGSSQRASFSEYGPDHGISACINDEIMVKICSAFDFLKNKLLDAMLKSKLPCKTLPH